jgi:hypothetical protein
MNRRRLLTAAGAAVASTAVARHRSIHARLAPGTSPHQVREATYDNYLIRRIRT